MTTQLEVTRLWNDGVLKSDQKDFAGALEILKKITDPTSKVTFDIGCLCLLNGDLNTAVEFLDKSVRKDKHMVVGFVQRGIVKYKLGRYPDALSDFNNALASFNGNLIDYKQLGMKLKLYACEILLNRAACYQRLGKLNEAQTDLADAVEGKSIPAHSIIDDAIDAFQSGSIICLYELPADALYRPPSYKTDHMEKRHHLGKAMVLASVKDKDTYTGFEGALKFPRTPSPTPKRKPLTDDKTVLQARKSPTLPAMRLRGTENTYKALYDFTPGTMSEIAMNEGDILMVSEKGDDGWYTAVNSRTHQKGLIPGSYVREQRQASPHTKRTSLPLTIEPSSKTLPVGLSAFQPPKGRPKSPVSSPKASPRGSPMRTVAKSPVVSPKSSPRASPMLGRRSPRVKDVVVKLHYQDTRAIEVPQGLTLADLTARAKKKFDVEYKQISLWKDIGFQLGCISSDRDMEDTWKSVTNGQLTLWMFEDKINQKGVPYIYEAEALYDYDAGQAGDLGFREGDIIQVIIEVNEEWLEGRSRGNMGIFPKSYVKRL
ncbi:neutrophil cytosol factor 2-like [Corticium candelabrum]|uniref:neutrophil cytosol factor 2-like n=1 Tax=Corticium candelabrum TaxID=121492 RepID=UPI002E272C14|nr:neutrophil cytosol factor 2-like [Corticium candelabrum]